MLTDRLASSQNNLAHPKTKFNDNIYEFLHTHSGNLMPNGDLSQRTETENSKFEWSQLNFTTK